MKILSAIGCKLKKIYLSEIIIFVCTPTNLSASSQTAFPFFKGEILKSDNAIQSDTHSTFGH